MRRVKSNKESVMRAYTQSQLEAINNVEQLLLKKEATERRQDEAIKKVEDLLQKRIGTNV